MHEHIASLERALGTEAWRLAVALSALVGSWIGYAIVIRALRRWAARTDTTVDDEILKTLRRPLGFLLPLVALTAAWPQQAQEGPGMRSGRHIALLATILCTGWLVTRGLKLAEVVLARRFDMSVADNLAARRVHTQLRGFRNIGLFAIGITTMAAILMTFDMVRQVGVSLLASAGVAGVVIGFAAQRSIATVVAGVQIALSQPIRVDDVVIVENEWGWIEEIALTYVVVRIWDQRRLVVPINYFIEKPFQNWTRTSSELLGTIFLYTDYSVPIDALREELTRLCKGSELWDGRVCQIVVTDAKEHTLELRALVSASDSGRAWDLRCYLREGLIRFLQAHHPEALPRFRVTAGSMPAATAA